MGWINSKASSWSMTFDLMHTESCDVPNANTVSTTNVNLIIYIYVSLERCRSQYVTPQRSWTLLLSFVSPPFRKQISVSWFLLLSFCTDGWLWHQRLHACTTIPLTRNLPLNICTTCPLLLHLLLANSEYHATRNGFDLPMVSEGEDSRSPVACCSRVLSPWLHGFKKTVGPHCRTPFPSRLWVLPGSWEILEATYPPS